MSEPMFLTFNEVIERYRGQISEGTLRNWRSIGVGPSFLKIGKAVQSVFRHFIGGSLALASPNLACWDHVPTFSATFTTIAFDDSSLRWLEINT
jgi:hypothetical protein